MKRRGFLHLLYGITLSGMAGNSFAFNEKGGKSAISVMEYMNFFSERQKRGFFYHSSVNESASILTNSQKVDNALISRLFAFRDFYNHVCVLNGCKPLEIDVTEKGHLNAKYGFMFVPQKMFFYTNEIDFFKFLVRVFYYGLEDVSKKEIIQNIEPYFIVGKVYKKEEEQKKSKISNIYSNVIGGYAEGCIYSEEKCNINKMLSKGKPFSLIDEEVFFIRVLNSLFFALAMSETLNPGFAEKAISGMKSGDRKFDIKIGELEKRISDSLQSLTIYNVVNLFFKGKYEHESIEAYIQDKKNEKVFELVDALKQQGFWGQVEKNIQEKKMNVLPHKITEILSGDHERKFSSIEFLDLIGVIETGEKGKGFYNFQTPEFLELVVNLFEDDLFHLYKLTYKFRNI